MQTRTYLSAKIDALPVDFALGRTAWMFIKRKHDLVEIVYPKCGLSKYIMTWKNGLTSALLERHGFQILHLL